MACSKAEYVPKRDDVSKISSDQVGGEPDKKPESKDAKGNVDELDNSVSNGEQTLDFDNTAPDAKGKSIIDWGETLDFSWNLPSCTEAKLEIQDLEGTTIQTITVAKFPEGNVTIPTNSASAFIPPGLYQGVLVATKSDGSTVTITLPFIIRPVVKITTATSKIKEGKDLDVVLEVPSGGTKLEVFSNESIQPVIVLTDINPGNHPGIIPTPLAGTNIYTAVVQQDQIIGLPSRVSVDVEPEAPKPKPKVELSKYDDTKYPIKEKPYDLRVNLDLDVDKLTIIDIETKDKYFEGDDLLAGDTKISITFPNKKKVTLQAIAIKENIEGKSNELKLKAKKCASKKECRKLRHLKRCEKKEKKTYEVSIRPMKQCEWSVDDNLDKRDRYLTARIEDDYSVKISEHNVFCGVESIKSAPGQKIRYDDHIILAFNDIVLLSSFESFSKNLVKKGEFFLYDWIKIRGQYGHDLSSNFNSSPYCIANEEDSRCSFPSHDKKGPFDFYAESDLALRIATANSSHKKRYHKLKVVTFGDNDKGDCELYISDKKDLKLNITLWEAPKNPRQK